MSKSAKKGDLGAGSVGTAEFSRDGMLEVLSNQRRRFAIHALKQHDSEGMTVSELAERVASWENDKDPDRLTYKERKRVRNALRQYHLPKMEEYGFVEYDSKRGTVDLTDTAASTDFYMDSLTGGDIPWGMYYLGLAGLSAVGLVGIWFNVYPFTLVSALSWSLFFVTALGLSAVGHFYDNYYRMRLGARERPPEVEE